MDLAPKSRPKQGKRPDFPRLLGGKLALDFVNTIESRRGRHPEEFLNSYTDLVHWGEHVALLSSMQIKAMLDQAKTVPKAAEASIAKAISIRGALYRIFLAHTRDGLAKQKDIDLLQKIHVDALSHAQFSPIAGGYKWQWPAGEKSLDTVIWSVAKAAVELLSSLDLQRIKECPGAGDCGWLFFDASKNRSRRWCSMEGCGSRVKMRRQYARQRGT